MGHTMHKHLVTRRTLLGAAALPWLAGCTTPLPLGRPSTVDVAAANRMRESAEVHGLSAYRQLNDINGRIFGAIFNDVDLRSSRYGQGTYYYYRREGYYASEDDDSDKDDTSKAAASGDA